jgi:hypothetical protein
MKNSFLGSTFKVIAAIAGLSSGVCFAAEVDPTTLYSVSTDGSVVSVKPGEKGKLVLAIQTKPGAHVSDEAPLKLELTGKAVQPEKKKLSLADSVAPKAEGKKYTDPKFDVPFALDAGADKGELSAKLTFFICTDQLCARQQKTLKLDVKSEGSK